MGIVLQDTFEPLDYTVQFRPKSFLEWNSVIDWCNEHVGEYQKLWVSTGAEMQIPQYWHFKFEEDSVLFAVRWL